jgi:hypothetical protein
MHTIAGLARLNGEHAAKLSAAEYTDGRIRKNDLCHYFAARFRKSIE